MKRVILGSVICFQTVVSLACSAPAQAPDPIVREIPSIAGNTEPPGGPDLGNDNPDAGNTPLDAGVCCVVPFALLKRADEQVAFLRFAESAQLIGLVDDNAGVWRGNACVRLGASLNYFYRVGLTSEAEDGGLFWTSRTNSLLPSNNNPTWGEVNTFDVAGQSCAALDAAVHSQVPDGGVSVASSDGGM